ncbi:hypothetical protein E2C01_101602 [Portunus trituberculatus]|uniref:Uncharacterized protein n=1 Tax=Portunus trituberculatus TaxID=210409 RepID=A0A5B7KB57_PORTR|nr:hypothetical protein [Portunus trituberculatus]
MSSLLVSGEVIAGHSLAVGVRRSRRLPQTVSIMFGTLERAITPRPLGWWRRPSVRPPVNRHGGMRRNRWRHAWPKPLACEGRRGEGEWRQEGSAKDEGREGEDAEEAGGRGAKG